MKGSNKGAGKNIAAHIAEQDALPQTIFQPRGSSDKHSRYADSCPTEPVPNVLASCEDDFRKFVKKNYTPDPAPTHLLQKIRLAILAERPE